MKQFKHKWLIGIILWVIVIFFACFKLPSTKNLIENNGQTQFTKSSQMVTAQQMQQKWGRNLDGAQRVSVVYHTNNDQKINTTTQSKITAAITKLAKQNKQLGIKRITDLNTNPNGQLQLLSHDKTTEIVNLYVAPNTNLGKNWQSEVRSLMQIKGFDNYVTSSQILNQENTQRVSRSTGTITLVAIILAFIVMAFLFKSLIAPLISLIATLVAYVTSLSLIENITIRSNASWLFTAYTPLITLLITLILGTLFNFILFQRSMENSEETRNRFEPVVNALKESLNPLLTSCLVLVIIFAGFAFIPFAPFQSLVSVTITVAILVLVTTTLTPILVGWVGSKLIWPSHNVREMTGSKIWNKLTHFSLWQPLAGILVALYIIGPLVYTYNYHLNYSNQESNTSKTQAAMGSNLLKAHFSQGKPTPVTVYVSNNKPLNNETDLQQIDALTNKLKSTSNVNSVYSVTQPSGLPISKYYVYNQLNNVTTAVNGSQKRLSHMIKDAKKGKKDIKFSTLNKQIKALQKAKDSSESLSTNQSQVDAQAKQATNKSNSSSKKASAQNVASYNNSLNELSQSINKAISGMKDATNVASSLEEYKSQLETVKSQLDLISTKAKATNSSLNDVYNYIEGLAHSSAANTYYITPSQLADTDFQQSLFNYTSQDLKMTQIEIILNNTPDYYHNVRTMNEIENVINTQIQGTPLANAKIAINGQPERQAETQTKFKHSMNMAIMIIAGISLLALFILSRAILQPIYWLVTFVASALAGMSITGMLLHWTTGDGRINWQAGLILIALLTALAVWQLVPIAIAYRERDNSIISWLDPSLTRLGQIVKYLWIIIIVIAISCFFNATITTMAVSFALISTSIIFNITLPMLISAFGKLAEVLPQNKAKKNK